MAMGEIFSYSLVSGLLLLVMYPVYKWLLAGERQHGFNRAVLWLIYVSALLLPALVPSLRGLVSALSPSPHAAGIAEAGMPVVEMVETGRKVMPVVFLGIYLAGVAVALALSVVTGLRLARVIGSGERYDRGDYTLILLPAGAGIAPFSWLRYVVMGRDDHEASAEAIIIHEKRHLALLHWVDMAFAQAVAIFLWYDPAAWLMREELKAVHEYQADEAVMTSGADIRQYQILLVKKAVGARFPSLANSLNHSKLKKRITMMYKSRSSVSRRLCALALVPAAAVALGVTAVPAVASLLAEASAATVLPATEGKVSEISIVGQTSVSDAGGAEASTTITINGEKHEYKKSPVYYVDGVRQDDGFDLSSISPSDITAMTIRKDTPETALYIELNNGDSGDKTVTLPQFPGGERGMMEWIATHVVYPKDAQKAKKEGRVVVRFVVGADGYVKQPEVIRSVSPSLDAEALRVIGSMPRWEPGVNNGKPVDCQYTIPVSFKLQ